jgi:hypothetical protein
MPLKLAREKAEQFGLQLNAEFLGKHSPNLMSENSRCAKTRVMICEFVERVHSFWRRSRCAITGRLCPVGMIFVPSVDGTVTRHLNLRNGRIASTARMCFCRQHLSGG